MPRIGEMLVAKGLIERVVLERALADQSTARQRIVSFLVERGLVDPDAATLALSEQKGVPAALSRHIDRRDAGVVALVPAELARKWVVCPIAFGRSGALVIAARDPGPLVERALEFALRRTLLIAVAPAAVVERAVASSYGEPDPDAFELPDPIDPPALAALDLPQEPVKPFELAELPRRSRSVSEFLPPATVADAVARARSVTNPPNAMTRKALEHAVEGIEAAGNYDKAISRALDFVALRWRSALLLEVEGTDAVGMAQHRVDVDPVESIVLNIESPSSLQVAYGMRATTTKRPLGPVQDRLTTLLGTISAAAPVIVRGKVMAVLVVGATVPDTPKDGTADLEKLVDALGAAFARRPP
jgi:hypothetical protein